MLIGYDLTQGFGRKDLLTGCSSPEEWEKTLKPASRRQRQGPELEDYWMDVFKQSYTSYRLANSSLV